MFMDDTVITTAYLKTLYHNIHYNNNTTIIIQEFKKKLQIVFFLFSLYQFKFNCL